MHLKIVCDGYYSFFPRFCKLLYFSGYDISLEFLSKKKYADSDGFFDFLLSKKAPEEFVQLCYCHPRNVSRGAGARHAIAVIDSARVREHSKIKGMDKIIILNSVPSRGGDVEVFDYFFEDKIKDQRKSGKTFLCSVSGDDVGGVSDLVLAYCGVATKHKDVSLLVNMNSGFSENVTAINRAMSLNGFRTDEFSGLHITNRSSPEEVAGFADYGIFLHDNGYFNVLALDLMARRIPIVVPNCEAYSNICRKNVCDVFDRASPVPKEIEEKMTDMILSESYPKILKAELIARRNSRESFLNKINEVLNGVGVYSGSCSFFSVNDMSEIII